MFLRLSNITKNIHTVLFILIVLPVLVSCSSNTTSSCSDSVENDTCIKDLVTCERSETSSIIPEEVGNNPLQLMKQAFVKTKSQLLIIFEILFAVLLILSIMLYLAEHHAQPKVYKKYPTSLLWTFVKCIQDPGEMAPPKPITIFFFSLSQHPSVSHMECVLHVKLRQSCPTL